MSKYPKYRSYRPSPYNYRVQIKENWFSPWRTLYVYRLPSHANDKMDELMKGVANA